MANPPPYAAAGETALAVVLERYLAKYPAAAEEYRSFFDDAQPVLRKLSWAVSKRVDANSQPHRDIPTQAITALRNAYIANSPPDQLADITEFFAEYDALVLGLAKGITKQLLAGHEANPGQDQGSLVFRSFVVEVKTKGDSGWSKNSVRYSTQDAAKRAGAELASRWMAVEEWRVEPSTDAPNDQIQVSAAPTSEPPRAVDRTEQEKQRSAGQRPSSREQEDPDLWSVKDRTEANLRAIEILDADQDGPTERRALQSYSGWGGLSLNAVAYRIPEKWVPQLQALVNEYYTPMRLCREVARVLLPLLAAMSPQEPGGKLHALEPSAGVGRFIRAFSDVKVEGLNWTAVEYSSISATILTRTRPDIEVFEGPFEKWVAQNEERVAGQLDLVVSNPPYGKRGATVTLDPDSSYRDRQAYTYFLRRCSDLVRAGGLAIFLIPYGFMSGKTPGHMAVRRKMLLRHHLLVAFRLPSTLFPGANIVTDLVFFQARGGEMASILADDERILAGYYFDDAPYHILGTVVGEQEPDDPNLITKKARFGYEIAGEFVALPAFTPRPVCTSCWVEPFRHKKPTKLQAKREDLPAYLQAGLLLGERVAQYLRHYGAANDSDDAKTAEALYGELHDALLAWQQGRQAEGSAIPQNDRELQRAVNDFPELVSLLSAFDESGGLAPAFSEAPKYEPRYRGAKDDLVGQAAFLIRTRRRFSSEMLRSLRADIGADGAEALESALYAVGYCFDEGSWIDEHDYYTGDLWPKYRRAKELADKGDADAQRQAAKLFGLVGPVDITEIAAEPRMPWVPAQVIQHWLSDFTVSTVPELAREAGLLLFLGESYAAVEHTEPRLSVAIGYINHDLSLFKLDYAKTWLDELEREETASEALDRVRLEYGKRAIEHFRAWLSRHPDDARAVETEYAARFRGYVLPVFEPIELEIARWRGDITLRPHQRSAANRLLHNGGGLCALDVGVGKTPTGIAVAARTRQEGRARRIMCVLPNTIMLKWEKEIRRALPDYRVLLIGLQKYVGRAGVLRSRTDTDSERALKYRQFQAGEYDIALVTYSMFGRTGLREETLRKFVAATAPLQRELGLRARNTIGSFEAAAEKDQKKQQPKKKKKKATLGAVRKLLGNEVVDAASLSELEQMRVEVAERLAAQQAEQQDELRTLLESLTDITERNRAVFSLEVDRWIAEQLEGQEQDPGIYWEDLKVDLLLLDEAQNFKNLWAVSEREGGVPKFLGAIQEGSQRAWNFATRAFDVRERNGGTGVVLLSATPAKNSPLEYFTLLGYVAGDAWSRLGITDTEVFIDRYLRLEERTLIEVDLTKKKRMVVAGFQNLNELRDVIFRYAEFRTAQEVGLKLPETKVETRAVDMTPAQKSQYEELVVDYADALKKAGLGEDRQAKMKALGLLQSMSLVSIHPELVRPPAAEVKRGVSLDDVPDASSHDELEEEAEATTESHLEDKAPPTPVRAEPKRGHWTFRNARLATQYSSPKIAEAVAIGTAAKNCANIYFCDNVAVHYWLKQELIKAGVPAERIAILNADTAPTGQQRQMIADKFNGVPPVLDALGRVEQEGTPPEYDHIICNAVAYEGIDLQVRTCQIIHLDLPYEPATLQQRNGRAVRQGNMQAVIQIIYLVSHGTVDVLRLQMITGKLQWMKDILQGADRETNNPAAQSEVSVEEMLLYLSSSNAQAAVEELRRQQEDERKRGTLKGAWATLRMIVSRVASLSRKTEPNEQAAAHTAIDEGKRRLAQIPAEAWPWAFLIEIAEAGTPLLVVRSSVDDIEVPIWEGARQWQPQGLHHGVEVGRIEGGSFGFRNFGEYAFALLDTSAPGYKDRLKVSAFLLDTPDPKGYSLPWPEDEDRAALEPGLRRALDSVRAGDFEAVGIRWAHDEHRVWFWQGWGLQFVLSLAEAPDTAGFLVPVLERGTFQLIPAGPTLKRFTGPVTFVSIVEPTEAGWSNFLGMAAYSGLKWTELNVCADSWWGRSFPRGVLKRSDETEAEWVTVKRDDLSEERIPAAFKSRFFALHRPVGKDDLAAEYTLTHLPSGYRASTAKTIEHGRAMIRFLESSAVDWDTKTPRYSEELGRQIHRGLATIRDSEAPMAALKDVLIQK